MTKEGNAELGHQVPSQVRHHEKVSSNKRVLNFVKEWGGVATVLIAILYTFPFDAASKFINWREQNILDARKALSEVAALYAAQTSALAATQDPQARSFLASTYSIRIYNQLSQNKAAIESARKELLSSELYMVGSLYTMAGLPDGLPYYKSALEKAGNDEKVTIYRELGNALFAPGPNQNIADARDAYVKALTLSSKIMYLQPAYSWHITELGGFELTQGDWKCGQELSSYGLRLLDLAVSSNTATPAIRDADTFFHGYIGGLTRKQDQPENGCPYKIPQLASNASPTTAASTSAPPSPLSIQNISTPNILQPH